MSRRRRHPPRVELGVGTALLVGGVGFLLVSVFNGFGPAWSFVGAITAMTGAGKAYRGGRDLQERRRRRSGTPKPPPRSHRWSESLPWASELYKKPKKTQKKTAQKKTTANLPCTQACRHSTAARSTCECPCGGTQHGTAARSTASNNGGARNGQRTTGIRRPA